jgi:hypothetical protein
MLKLALWVLIGLVLLGLIFPQLWKQLAYLLDPGREHLASGLPFVNPADEGTYLKSLIHDPEGWSQRLGVPVHELQPNAVSYLLALGDAGLKGGLARNCNPSLDSEDTRLIRDEFRQILRVAAGTQYAWWSSEPFPVVRPPFGRGDPAPDLRFTKLDDEFYDELLERILDIILAPYSKESPSTPGV